MIEPITNFNEEELDRKLLAKRRIRGLLVMINFVLAGYLIFQIGSNIVHLVKTADDVEGIVKINNKSQKESLDIYQQYVDEEKVLNGDFALYGEKMYFTKGNYCFDNLDPVDNVQLIKLENKRSNTIVERTGYYYQNVGQTLSDGVSLFYKNGSNEFLSKGDYLFYSDYVNISDFGNVIRVTNDLDMKYEMYSSTISSEGLRVKTTIYAYKNNPALVMNVDYVSSLPNNYYDVILIGQEELVNNIKENSEFTSKKILYKEEMTEQEMHNVSSNFIIKVIDEDKGNSEDIIYSSYLLNDGYQKSDDEFILKNMGYAYSRGFEFEFESEHHKGKHALIIDLKN